MAAILTEMNQNSFSIRKCDHAVMDFFPAMKVGKFPPSTLSLFSFILSCGTLLLLSNNKGEEGQREERGIEHYLTLDRVNNV